MATVEYITKRIEGKRKEIEKLEKKLDRILKAEATGWEVNPYFYNERDKKWALKDLETAKATLAGYEESLKTAVEKANSRNVTVILEFLKGWKERVFTYYMEAINEAAEIQAELDEAYRVLSEIREGKSYDTKEAFQAYREKVEAAEDECKRLRTIQFEKLHGYYEKKEFTNRWGRPDWKEEKVREGEWEYARDYITRNKNEGVEKLRKDLDREADAKYDSIIERTNEIVGTITDARGLFIGLKGDLNGIVLGERGKARVETIGAGGYNIQCYHFRTLIHAIG